MKRIVHSNLYKMLSVLSVIDLDFFSCYALFYDIHRITWWMPHRGNPKAHIFFHLDICCNICGVFANYPYFRTIGIGNDLFSVSVSFYISISDRSVSPHIRFFAFSETIWYHQSSNSPDCVSPHNNQNLADYPVYIPLFWVSLTCVY